jgi:hypothetical protein
MSIDTTEAQAAARAAELEWKQHRGQCHVCGNTRRTGLGRCKTGRQLHQAAADARTDAQESAIADKNPGENGIPLFETSEITSLQVSEGPGNGI